MKRFILWAFALLIMAEAANALQISVTRSILAGIVTGNSNTLPSIVLNTKTGDSLVVWERVTGTQHVIFGRLLGPGGAALPGLITLSTNPNASHPAVAYNSTRNEFLLTYDDNPGFQLSHSDIYVRRLKGNGQPLTAEAKISTDSTSSTLANFFPKVIFSPAKSTYVVLWLREVTLQVGPGNNGLVGLVLSGTAQISGSPVLIRKTIVEQPTGSVLLLEPVPLDAKINSVSGKLIVAIVQQIAGTNSSQINYYVGAMNPTLVNAGSTSFPRINATSINSTANFVRGFKMVFQSTGAGFAVFVDTTRIRLRNLNSSGGPVGIVKAAFNSPKASTKLFYPDLVLTNGASGERVLLVAIQDVFSTAGQATLWTQVLDASGVRLGTPVQVDITGSGQTAGLTALSALPHAVTVTTYPFIAAYQLATVPPSSETITTAGLIKLKINLTFP